MVRDPPPWVRGTPEADARHSVSGLGAHVDERALLTLRTLIHFYTVGARWLCWQIPCPSSGSGVRDSRRRRGGKVRRFTGSHGSRRGLRAGGEGGWGRPEPGALGGRVQSRQSCFSRSWRHFRRGQPPGQQFAAQGVHSQPHSWAEAWLPSAHHLLLPAGQCSAGSDPGPGRCFPEECPAPVSPGQAVSPALCPP